MSDEKAEEQVREAEAKPETTPADVRDIIINGPVGAFAVAQQAADPGGRLYLDIA